MMLHGITLSFYSKHFREEPLQLYKALLTLCKLENYWSLLERYELFFQQIYMVPDSVELKV